MKTSSKILSTIIVVTMLFSLCACNNDGSVKEPTSTPDSTDSGNVGDIAIGEVDGNLSIQNLGLPKTVVSNDSIDIKLIDIAEAATKYEDYTLNLEITNKTTHLVRVVANYAVMDSCKVTTDFKRTLVANEVLEIPLKLSAVEVDLYKLDFSAFNSIVVSFLIDDQETLEESTESFKLVGQGTGKPVEMLEGVDIVHNDKVNLQLVYCGKPFDGSSDRSKIIVYRATNHSTDTLSANIDITSINDEEANDTCQLELEPGEDRYIVVNSNYISIADGKVADVYNSFDKIVFDIDVKDSAGEYVVNTNNKEINITGLADNKSETVLVDAEANVDTVVYNENGLEITMGSVSAIPDTNETGYQAVLSIVNTLSTPVRLLITDAVINNVSTLYGDEIIIGANGSASKIVKASYSNYKKLMPSSLDTFEIRAIAYNDEYKIIADSVRFGLRMNDNTGTELYIKNSLYNADGIKVGFCGISNMNSGENSRNAIFYINSSNYDNLDAEITITEVNGVPVESTSLVLGMSSDIGHLTLVTLHNELSTKDINLKSIYSFKVSFTLKSSNGSIITEVKDKVIWY